MATQKRIAAILLSLGLLAGGTAFGADNGYYIGGSWGQARPDFNTSNSVANMGASIDTSDVAWKAWGGYQFNKFIGVEVIYINLGSYAVSNGNTIEPAGWGIALVGTAPITDTFALFAKIGEYRIRQKMNPASVDDNTWSPSFGLGMKYNFNPNFFGRLEYERIQSIGSDTSTIDNNSNVYTLGLGYKF